MIHSVRRIFLFATLCWSTHAFAFLPPERTPLQDYDARAFVAWTNNAVPYVNHPGLQHLKTLLPQAEVEFDALTGAPKYISARERFLSGANGSGGAVPSATAARFSANDPDRATKAFVFEHRGVFGHGPEVLDKARVKRDFVTPHNGMRTKVWEQQVDDIAVFESVLISHTTRRGELVNLSSEFLPDAESAASRGVANRKNGIIQTGVAARRAVVAAARNIELNLDEAGLAPATEANAVEGFKAEQREFFSSPLLKGNAEAKLIWLPLSRDQLRLCWDVVLMSRARGEMFRVLVDAQTGEVLLRRCLTEYISDATYRVFTSDSPSPFSPGYSTPTSSQPPVTSRSLITLPALDTNASPNGWINDGGNETLGNNVDAHTDWGASNGSNLPRPQGSPFRVFDPALDLSQAPHSYSNAAVVQLFYWNNFMHDRLYELGFTEAAGNFQTANFGRGGLGNDAVQADAQDGSGYNNANFSTPSDGSAGRMQMYIFNGPTPNRDGDFDAEVVCHEYTHGLSNRRVGGGVGISALQPRGMGEGWSDFYGMSLLSEATDDVNGVYASGGYVTYQLSGMTQNYYFGIRRYPYCTDTNKNPLTFKDIDPAQASSHTSVPRSSIVGTTANEVHNMGEVWCVALWDARANLINKYGWAVGNQLILQLVTDGMNLSPANPTFLQARDAILQADQVDTGGANLYELWKAFAKRGMGLSATSPASSTTSGVLEAYDLPFLPLQIVVPVSATEGDGVLSGAGQVRIQSALGTNVIVQLASSNTLAVTVPASVTIFAGQTNAVFDVTILDDALLNGTRSVTISASAPGFANANGTISLFDNETATLQVLLPGSVTKGQGLVQGTVQVTVPVDSDVSVALSSGVTNLIQLPAAVVIPAGQTSVLFTATVLTDGQINGGQNVNVTAHVQNWTDGVASVAVADNLTLTVALPGSAWENAGVLTNAGSVKLAGTSSSSITVNLASDHPERMTVPVSVTIPAGSLSNTFNITLVDNSDVDGQQTVTVTAGAFGFMDGTAPVLVMDDESPMIPINPRPAHLATSVLANTNLMWVNNTNFGSAELVTNGGFEVGTLTNWTVVTSAGGTFVINNGTVNPPSPDGPLAPYSGGYSALGQSSGPGSFYMYQTVTVPANATSAVLSWAHRVRNFYTAYNSSQQFQVRICDTNSASTILATAFTTNPGDTLLGNWVQTNYNMAAFTGRTVRVMFWVSSSSYYLDAHVDSVSLAVSTPAANSVGIATNDVYFGTNATPALAEFRGSTTNSSWTLPLLAPQTTYYWQIIAHRGGSATSAVWRFTTEGVDHFVWNAVASPQFTNQPFAVTITAKDRFNTTVSNFFGAVSLMGTNVSVIPALTGNFSDGAWSGLLTIPQRATNLVLKAADAGGHVGTTTAFDVVPANMPPVILLQPTNKTVVVGSSTTFSVVADGTPRLAFQWTMNGTNLLGATNATLVLTNIQFDQAGTYAVQVTNAYDLITSSNAELTVVPPPPVPIITSISPTVAAVGTNITITGTNFNPIAGNDIVYFGATRGVVTSASVTNLVVTVPSGATFGPITVTVFGLSGQSNQRFLPRFYGNGSPISAATFASRQDIAAGSRPQKAVIADLDGDGKPDLIVAEALNNTLAIYRNISTNGSLSSSSFASRVTLKTAAGSASTDPWTFAVADIDGDGRLDLIAVDADNKLISIFGNLCSPGNITTNSFANRIDLAGATGMRALAIGDLDGDGKPEIVTGNQTDNTLSIFQNLGSSGNIAFSPRVDLTAGNGASEVVVADLDGDGMADLAVVNFYAGTLSVYRNLMSAAGIINTNSFMPKFDCSAPASVYALMAADVDGDGKLDLISGASDSSQLLSLYRNVAIPGTLSTNSFQPRVDYALGGRGHTLSVGDLDGDGKADIAVVTEINSYLSIFQNLATPGALNTASLAPRVDLPSGNNAWGVFLGDLDGDNRADIVFCNAYDNTISLYQNITPFGGPPISISDASVTEGNLGTTNLVFQVSLAAPNAQTVTVAYATTNGTAIAGTDYIATNGVLTFLPGDTNKTISVAIIGDVLVEPDETLFINLSHPTNSSLQQAQALGTIMNDDGLPGQVDHFTWATIPSPQIAGQIFEVIITAQDYSNNVAASFNGSVILSATNVGVTPSVSGAFTNGLWSGEIDVNQRATNLVLRAADGEGHAGLSNPIDVGPPSMAPVILSQPTNQIVLVGSNAGFSVIADGTPPLSFQWLLNGTNVSEGTNAMLILTNIQLNQAGDYSVLVSNMFDGVTSSNASLTVILPPQPPVITGIIPATAVAGANIVIDGTNFSPVAANNIVYFGATRGMVTTASITNLVVTVPTGATFGPITVTTFGLTGQSNQRFLPRFIGDGTAVTASSFGPRQDVVAGAHPSETVLADLDGDGKPDLIVADASDSTLSIYRNISTNGALFSGSFAPRVILRMVGGTGTDPWTVAAFDLDGDGKQDLVALDADNKNVSIFRNIGAPGSITTNAFAARIDLPAGEGMRGLAIGDLNGDGKPDIVTGNQTANTISVFQNTGSFGTIAFSSRVDFTAGTGASEIAIADLDGDSKPDLAVVNYYAGTMSVYRNVATSAAPLTTNSFNTRVDYVAPVGAYSLMAADVDGDGKLDLILGASENSQMLSLYRNVATPGSLSASSFQPRVDFGLGGRGHTFSMGDLNGDGKADIAITTELNSYLSLFQNIATPGSLSNTSLATRVDLGTGWNAWGVSVGDLDGDNRADLVFCNTYDNTLSIYRNITPVASAPSFVLQPASQIVRSGSNVTFIASATGTAPLKYFWQKNNSPIAGMTNTTLMLTNVTRTNSGSYFVVVTNVAGSASSSNATLTVHVPQNLGAPVLLPDGTITFLSGDSDGGQITPDVLAEFQLQASSNLVDWMVLSNALAYTNGMISVQDSSATNSPQRFYRIIENW